VSKLAQECALLSPIIKVILIQRLSEEDALNLLGKHGHKMSARKFYSLKKEYNQGTTNRFLQIAKSEWADEHLLIIDKIRLIEKKYWELYNECEEPRDAKAILDSIRATQEQLTLFYNETPLMQKTKEVLEAKLEELTNAKT